MGQWIAGSTFATAFYHSDGNGNVTCLMYPNGTLAAKYLYDPFGNMLSQYGSLASANRYRFSSKEWDAASGLYYYLYRFYDPNLQRWPNRDPIMDAGSRVYDQMPKVLSFLIYSEEKIADSHGFLFVKESPVSNMDLFGLQSWMGPGYGAFGPGGVQGSSSSSGSSCPCGQTPKNLYQQSPYNGNFRACATAQWDLLRDTANGTIGLIVGGISGAGASGAIFG